MLSVHIIIVSVHRVIATAYDNVAQIYRLRGAGDSAAIKGWTGESGEREEKKEKGCWQREEALLVVIMKDDSRTG